MENNNNFNNNNNFTTADDGKTTAIISYFTIIGWLIAYFAMYKDNKTALASYQLRQTLLYHLISLVVYWGVGFIIGILVFSTGIVAFVYLMYIFYIALFVVWIVGLIGAINGEQKPMPIIGQPAQSIFSSI